MLLRTGLSSLAPLLAVLWVAAFPSTGRADPMDVALSRLAITANDAITDPSDPNYCPASLNDGSTRAFCADEASYRSLLTELATAMAPPILAPARTLGSTGLYVGFDSQITNLHSEQSFWQNGTVGDDPSAGSGDPNGTLTMSRLTVRKGLPFGMELGFSLGHAYQTSYWTWGLTFQIAPFEGFRTGAGWLPDFAVRGSVQTMTGAGEFNLTVPTLDFILSKPLVIAEAVRFTPIVGAQLLWAVVDSEVVDLTPQIDAFAECFPDAGAPVAGDLGTLRCDTANGGSPDDFNNNAVFSAMRTRKWRLAVGAQVEYESLVVNAAFHLDVGSESNGAPQFSDFQWTLALGAGVGF